jgi:phosphoenolpyruvate---glycerone phosphotransferase subunit DhaM
VVGIVIVSHSSDLAKGLAELASQLGGGEVGIEPAGGAPNGDLGTSDERIAKAIARADRGAGVVVLGDLGSAFLTARHVLEHRDANSIRLADAPLVEGTIAAVVAASAGQGLDDVAGAAERTRGARKF